MALRVAPAPFEMLDGLGDRARQRTVRAVPGERLGGVSLCTELAVDPSELHLLRLAVATVAAGPLMAAEDMLLPSFTPSTGVWLLDMPTIRLIHPVRSLPPGAASSMVSMAEKCDRLATGNPTACTAASSPEAQYLLSGAIWGCSPNMGSLQISEAAGMAVLGRAL